MTMEQSAEQDPFPNDYLINPAEFQNVQQTLRELLAATELPQVLQDLRFRLLGLIQPHHTASARQAREAAVVTATMLLVSACGAELPMQIKPTPQLTPLVFAPATPTPEPTRDPNKNCSKPQVPPEYLDAERSLPIKTKMHL